jgi:hypothetical protein
MKLSITIVTGGLKLWEGSLDLVKALNSDMKEGRLLLEGKRVLEVGCLLSGVMFKHVPLFIQFFFY